MKFRLTKDLLAVIITSVFLVWVVATAFAPIILQVQVYYDKGQTLVELDAFAAVFCVLGYILIGRGLPERMRSETK